MNDPAGSSVPWLGSTADPVPANNSPDSTVTIRVSGWVCGGIFASFARCTRTTVTGEETSFSTRCVRDSSELYVVGKFLQYRGLRNGYSRQAQKADTRSTDKLLHGHLLPPLTIENSSRTNRHGSSPAIIYSITSSARASSVGGTLRPIVSAS